MFNKIVLPEGYSEGFIFSIATGKMLDVYGDRYNIIRKQWMIFKEPDFIYKKRILEKAIEELNQ